VGAGPDEPHAFISYVREDAAQVDRLQRFLEGAGIRVWRDTKDLWPGEDWRLKIREAITNDAMVFIACFSQNSAARTSSFQNEELVLAVDEFRKRSPDQTWLIPVRFSDCILPQFDLGAARTLDSLQRVDLWGHGWDEGTGRLLTSVLRAFERLNPQATKVLASPLREGPGEYVKARLLDATRHIELDDYIAGVTDRVVTDLLNSEIFPAQSERVALTPDGLRFLVGQTNEYFNRVGDLLEVLIAGCGWGRPQHSLLWRRSLERVATTAQKDSGIKALLNLRRFPILPLLYASTLAALSRENYVALKAVAIDARVRRVGEAIPMVSAAHPGDTFSVEMVPQLLAHEAGGEDLTDALVHALSTRGKGRRHTPVSDFLFAGLRSHLRVMIPDDAEYQEGFDRAEVILGVLAMDQKLQFDKTETYVRSPWFGAFTWRDRYSRRPLEARLFDEARAANPSPLLAAGLFGGDANRMDEAFKTFIARAQPVRDERMW
jgi:hypothetical protein